MANKLAGGVKAGTTGYSHTILLLAAADGSEMSGKLAADLTISYYRQGDAAVTAFPALTDLAALNTPWAAGGVKEKSAALARGSYRVDVPDAMIAAGRDYVELFAFCAGSQVFTERIPLETAGAAEVKADTAAIFAAVDPEVATLVSLTTAINAAVAAIGGIVSQFRFTTANQVDANALSGGGGGGGDPAAIAAAVGAGIVEPHGNITRDQAQRLMLAVLAGVTTSGGLVFKTPDGSTVRLTVTANSQKERVVVTATP